MIFSVLLTYLFFIYRTIEQRKRDKKIDRKNEKKILNKKKEEISNQIKKIERFK